MASRWSTALVLPPSAIATAMPFSNACAGEDLARQEPTAHGLHQDLARPGRALRLFRVLGGHGGGSGQAHAHGLEHRRHRVGGEHPAAGALAGAGVALDLEQLALVDAAGAELADRLEGAHHGEVAAVQMARA